MNDQTNGINEEPQIIVETGDVSDEANSLNGSDEVSRKQNKFAKLLSQRNALRQQLEELHHDKEVYKNLAETMGLSTQAPSASLAVNAAPVSQIPVLGADDTEEKKIFLDRFPTAAKNLEDIHAVREELPNLSWEYAYRIACPDQFSQSGFGETKSSLQSTDISARSAAENSSLPLATLSADELEAKATELWKQNRIRI